MPKWVRGPHPGAYGEAVDIDRIRIDHRIMAGVPCIRGTRIPVATVVGLVAEGVTIEEVVADYPQLTREDVEEALRFAASQSTGRRDERARGGSR